MSNRRLNPVFPAIGIVALAAVVLLILTSDSGTAHRVAFVVPNATNLVPGLQVRAAGQKVGRLDSVRTVDGGRRARVVLKITDDKVWPLPKDTTFRAHFSGTVAYTGRYIEIRRGTATGTPFAEGATIPISRVQMPVEIDSVVNIFGPRTRENLRSTVDAAGAALTATRAPLRRSLDRAPAAALQANGIAQDAGADLPALASLVRSTNRVVAAANTANPGIGPLIADTSTTLTAISSRAAALKQTLTELPATMTSARRTLQRADSTLESAADMSRRLAPGVERLIDITPSLNRTLRTVTEIGPDAKSTLRTVRTQAPTIDKLLRSATKLMPDLQSTLTQAKTQIACVRPFAPEIAGFASTWASFVATGDQKDKYARLYFGTYPYPNVTPLTVPQAAKLTPDAFSSWGFPRAPGANVNQPWYQPDCGVTADGADPQKAPDAGVFDPLARPFVSTNPPARK